MRGLRQALFLVCNQPPTFRSSHPSATEAQPVVNLYIIFTLQSWKISGN